MLSNLDRTPAIKHLLIINVSVFLLMFFIPQFGQFFNLLALYYFDAKEFAPWQIVTHMFMHAGFMHVGINMLMLFQFGPILEKNWGTKKFLIFYFTAGLGGVLFFNLNLAGVVNYVFHTFQPISEGLYSYGLPSAVGASAAITGVVVAFAYLHPNTELMLMFIPIPIKAKFLVGGFLLWDLISGILNSLSVIQVSSLYTDDVAHWAHLGGAFFGIILLVFWQKDRTKFY